MSADVTAAAAASAAAATASAFLGAAFGLPLDTVCCGLLGSLLGLSAVKESPSTWRAAAQFVGYAIGGALVGTWASSNQIAHNGIAFGVALALIGMRSQQAFVAAAVGLGGAGLTVYALFRVLPTAALR